MAIFRGGGASGQQRGAGPPRYRDRIVAGALQVLHSALRRARELQGDLAAAGLQARAAGLKARAARILNGLPRQSQAPAAQRSRPVRRGLARLGFAAFCVFTGGVMLGASGGMAAVGALTAVAGLAMVAVAARALWPLLGPDGRS